MPDTQVRLTGIGVEWLVEVTWDIDSDERGDFVELQDLWIFGHYPEPNDKHDSVYIHADLGLLSDADERTIRAEIARDIKRLKRLAEEQAAEAAWEARYE
jgi:hypothetical protein